MMMHSIASHPCATGLAPLVRSCCPVPRISDSVSKPRRITSLFESLCRGCMLMQEKTTHVEGKLISASIIIRLTHRQRSSFKKDSYNAICWRTAAPFACTKSRQLNIQSTVQLLQPQHYIISSSGSANSGQMLVVQKSFFGLWSAVQGRLFSTHARDDGGQPSADRSSQDESREEMTCLPKDDKGHKRIKIRACGNLYQELSRTKPALYANAPVQGIEFNVQYYDSIDNQVSGPEAIGIKQVLATKQSQAIVCLLHGAPGQYDDFSSLIRYLSERGVRVIAPNLPDYNATYEHSFRHSPRERCAFLLEFFKAIKVDKIDLLIGHSSAVYTIFQLLEYTLRKSHEKDTTTTLQVIKSLGLFSTPSYRLPRNLAVTPFRLYTLKLFDYPLLRPIILACILSFVKLQGIRNRVNKGKIEDLLIAASAVGYSEHEKMAPRMNLLKEHNIPSLLIYGTNDRLISAGAFRKLEQDLGVKSEDAIKCYSSAGELAVDKNKKNDERRSQRDEQQLVKVCRFEKAGHYVFQRHARQVNAEVYQFLLERVLDGGGGGASLGPKRETTRL